MSPHITLVRHGRSAHVHTGWLDHAGLGRWFQAYDAAGLAPGQTPPADLLSVCGAAVVVASDLPRAVETAALLRPGIDVRTTPLLREMDIPAPALAGARLPLWAWGMVAYTRFSLGARATHAPRAAARARAEDAARWLAELAAERGGVVAVTHGAFRPFVADALVVRGWRPADRRRRSFAHWSAWTLVPGAAEPASPAATSAIPATASPLPTHRRA